MRVLFLTHPEADYGEYFLWNGLCEELGEESVIEVPFKKSYHGEVHTYAGYTAWREHGWGLQGTGDVGCTAPFEYAHARPGREARQEEVLDGLRSNVFDLVVVGSIRIEALRHLRMLRPEIKCPIIVHDGEDYADICPPHATESLSKIKLYLKRELRKEWLDRNWSFSVKPMPFSSPLLFNVICSKQVDVLCAVGDSNPVRAAAREVVSSMPSTRVLCGHWSYSRYIELICQSKIAVAPRGFGQDTVRRWEIPSFNTLLFCEKLDLIEHEPLRDAEHCVYYASPEELRSKLEWWLAHDDERERVALSGQDFVSAHHTNRARARQAIKWASE